jgi:MraZ protein
MLRGNQPAKIDAKGRLKIPATFRNAIIENYGSHVFVTSINGNSVRIYPSQVWEEIEEKLSTPPTTMPEKIKFMERTNYWGQEAEIDDQGRVLIHQHLRDFAKIEGDVAVMGQIKYLEVWADVVFFKERIEGQPFTNEDFEKLGQLGI